MTTLHDRPRAPIPPFTAHHEALRAEIRAFVAAELAPHAAEWEAARSFPDRVFTRMAERGYLGLKYPRDYGGEGRGHVADAVLSEELARCGSGGLAAGIGAHTGIATPPIFTFGTEEQKRCYLVPAIRGERIAALAITEPDAGSDVASIRTRARRVAGGWLLNGSKMFITHGVRADLAVTAVKTTEEGGHHGISFLIVDRGPGVEARPIEKLGWHASDTALITYDDVAVPESNLLGAEHEGFRLIMANFQWERLLMSLGAVGSMGHWLERTLAVVRDRAAAGRPLGGQALRHRLAELATTVEACRAVTCHALRLFDQGLDAVREVSEATILTQRACVDVVEACLDVHAAACSPAAHDAERALRDARLGPIGGGTDEIMKEVVGRSFGLS